MTDLTYRTVLPVQTLVSQEVPCQGKTEHGEKGQQNFHAMTWQTIFSYAGQAAAQSNHHCPLRSMEGSSSRTHL